MKLSRLRLLSAIAAVGLLFSAAPAHATDAQPDPTAPIVVKPDPSDRIIQPRPPRLLCPIKPVPRDRVVPPFCRGPIVPSPRPPWEIIDPIPGPGLPAPIAPVDK